MGETRTNLPFFFLLTIILYHDSNFEQSRTQSTTLGKRFDSKGQASNQENPRSHKVH